MPPSFATNALFVVGAYLLGAIPFGLLIGLAKGIDVRQHGSRNIGATNVGRVVGSAWGKVCLALDILKGFIPTFVTSRWLTTNPADPWQQATLVLVAIAAVLGHVFPVYLGFRGGKGVATTIGVALGIWPFYTVAMIAALIGYAAGRYLTGFVSVGSLALAVVFPAGCVAYLAIAGLPIGHYWLLLTVATLLGLLIIVRHHANIRRLLRGEEPRQAKSRAA